MSVDPRDVPFNVSGMNLSVTHASDTEGNLLAGGGKSAPRTYHVVVPATTAVLHQPPGGFVNRLYDNRRNFYKRLEGERRKRVDEEQQVLDATATFVPSVTPHPVHAFTQHTHVVERLSTDAMRRANEAPRSASVSRPLMTPASLNDSKSNEVLPRVAREYSEAQRERELHLAFLREKVDKDNAAPFKPVIHSSESRCSVRTPLEFLSSYNPTLADAARAATNAKRIREREAANRSILDDEQHRKARDELLQQAQLRSHSVRSVPPSSATNETPRPRKISEREAQAATERLYREATMSKNVMTRKMLRMILVRQQMEEEESLARRRIEREWRWVVSKAEHDKLTLIAPASAQCRNTVKPLHSVPHKTTVAATASGVIVESSASSPSRPQSSLDKPVVRSKEQLERLRKRNEEAAALVRRRRMQAEAIERESAEKEEQLAQLAENRYGPVSSRGRVPRMIAPCGTSVRGWSAVLKRRNLAERLKQEALEKCSVRPSAIHRVRDSRGKLVTHADPFSGLESHEQQMHEHRARVVEVLRAETTGPFVPVAKAPVLCTAGLPKEKKELREEPVRRRLSAPSP